MRHDSTDDSDECSRVMYIDWMNTVRMGLLCILMTAGCYGGPAGVSERAQQQAKDSDVAAKFKQVVLQVQFDHDSHFGDIAVALVDIRDSRCPLGANCFLAGEVTAVLNVTCNANEQIDATDLELTLPVRGTPTSATLCDHSWALVSVTPYPKEGVTVERGGYEVELKISALR